MSAAGGGGNEEGPVAFPVTSRFAPLTAPFIGAASAPEGLPCAVLTRRHLHIDTGSAGGIVEVDLATHGDVPTCIEAAVFRSGGQR
jgi:hypothetical protein